MSEDDRRYMGTAEEARAALIQAARVWRFYRQPIMGTAKELKAHAVAESEAQFKLANAALLWLWHEENTALPSDVVRLVIAARRVAFNDLPADREAMDDLAAASEAFAERVPWENDPEDDTDQGDEDDE